MSNIIIAVRNENGVIEADSIQDIEEWKNGEKNFKILIKKSGVKLFKILQEDLNYIQLNDKGIFELTYILNDDIEQTVMRLMGSIAEAIVVSRCNENKERNRKYATIARKGKRVIKTPDKYIAIGTGHFKTKKMFSSKYNPQHTQHDIIWINKKNPEKELLEVDANKVSGKTAALQIKASSFKSEYVFKEIKEDKYKVPLVYFGMRDNYFKILKKLKGYNSKINFNEKFIDIREIDEDAYYEFFEYKSLIKKLLDGKINPVDLLDSKDIIQKSALTTTLTSYVNKSIILPMS